MKMEETRKVKYDINGMEPLDKEKMAADTAKRIGFYKDAINKEKGAEK